MLTWYATRALWLILLTAATTGPLRAAEEVALCPRGYVELPGGLAPMACVMAQPKCTPGNGPPLTKVQQEAILKAHNDARSAAAKTQNQMATDMQKLVWDDELAKNAQDYAKDYGVACLAIGATPPADTHKGTDVGQNIEYEAAAFAPDKAVEKWVDQKAALTPKLTAPYKLDPATNKYAQVIWAETAKVGCGYYDFKMTNADHYIFVCNYKPSIKDGEPVYVIGPTICSGCPAGWTCPDKTAGLCEPPGPPTKATKATSATPSATSSAGGTTAKPSGGTAKASKSSWLLPGIAIAVTLVVMIGVFFGVYTMCMSHSGAAVVAAGPELGASHGGAAAGEAAAGEAAAGGGGAGEGGGSKEAIVHPQ